MLNNVNVHIVFWDARLTYKPHSVPGMQCCIAGDDHSSRETITRLLKQPTRASNGARNSFALLGFAPGGVCLANAIADAAGSLLHYLFTLTKVDIYLAIRSLLHLPSGCPVRPLTGAMRCRVQTFLRFDAQIRDRPVNLATLS